ncbi:hypothetical protein K8O93_08430 [Gordonia bronchialis]|uniref:hypothetical protein n=1 Tax=Gordonia bronchialis TaxID=2054 RepID=UPI001CBB7D3A|nr:hypothetical protein [Gordonia bronchialis]UAK39662.1 hypothetical protein K8O93_08430 [Gordonia bronchialis]
MKPDHTPNRTSRDDGDPLDNYVRAWLAERDQRIDHRGRDLVHSTSRGPWQTLTPSDLVDTITAAAAAFGEPVDTDRLLATIDALRTSAQRCDTRPEPVAGRFLRHLTRSFLVTR